MTILSTSACARAMRVATQLDQLARALHPFGEHVDVEVVAFELVEDVAELGHRVGVPDRVVTHEFSSSTRSTRLAIRPEASSVTSSSPTAASAARRTVWPFAARVML